jgi:hypothetical protein
MEDAVGVRRNGCLSIRNEQAPGHAQVNDPLQALRFAILKIEDDVFAYAVDAFDPAAGQLLGHQLRRRLERLGLSAEPGGFDTVPTETLIDSAGNGFDFRQFGHSSSSVIVAGAWVAVLGHYRAALYDQESEQAESHN